MAIKYLDSKRIVGLSTDTVETLSFEDNSFSSGWTQTGTAIVATGGQAVFTAVPRNAEHRIYKSLGLTVDNTKFILDFKINISAMSSQYGGIWVGLTDDTTWIASGGNDFLGFNLHDNGGGSTAKMRISSKNDGSGLDGSNSTTTFSSNGTTDYYIRLIRTSATNTDCYVYSDSARTTLVEKIPSFTTPSGIDTLTHIQVTSSTGSSATVTGIVDEIKLWSGVTSLTSKPTDVQDNSILVEKDTANRYWFVAGAGTTTKTYDHSGDTNVSVRSVSNSTNWYEAPRQGILIEAGHAAVGTYVKKISLPLLKVGTPTGNYTFAIRDSSETIKGSATGVANNLTTSYVITEVTLNTAVLIEVGDHVTIEYDNTAPATGKLSFPSSTSGWVANTDQQNWISSAWQGDGDGAGAGRKWQFTFDSTPASITLPVTWTYEPNANSSPLFDTHNGTGNSNSTTITVASNDNRLLIAHVGHSGTGVTVNSVTSNVSGAFTQLMTQNSDASTNNKTDVWYLKAPATGAHTVTVVYSGSVTNRSIALHSLYNVDQTTPINLSSKASAGSSTGTPITVDITPTIKNSVLMAVSQAQYSANTPSDTSIYMATYASGGDFNMSGQKKLSPTRDSSNTMSWAKNSNGAWSTVAFEVIGV